MTRQNRIPIMKPLLPTAGMIAPYLDEIDQSRWYSNFGPLTMRFEERLAELFDVPPTTLCSFSNGTAAITAMLRSMEIEEGSYCLIPSWTFVATAAAPTAANLEPHFLDVDEHSWALEPESVKEQLKYVPGKVGAVIVVAPFGAPIQVAPWDKFTEETGVPVIIDAAAGFDAVLQIDGTHPGRTPIMISLHATKPFGIGEGAFIISDDKLLLNKTRQMSNFGFMPDRDVALQGVNAKLNEYNAAVGLAALDCWPEKRSMWQRVTNDYIGAFSQHGGNVLHHRLSTDWMSSVCNVQIEAVDSGKTTAEHVIEQLGRAGIEARKWWPKGCHELKAYQGYKRFATPVTDNLTTHVIALPFSVDMAAEDVNYVVEELASFF